MENGLDETLTRRLSDPKYAANYGAHRVGIKPDEVSAYYNQWSHKYEEDLCPGVYNGPSYGAEALYRVYGCDNLHVRILDVAAGTGLCGVKLNERGFSNIDALDPSAGMLEKAMKKGVYTKCYKELFGPGKTSIQDDVYDAIVVTGGMGEGHIPVEGIDEMLRIVKRGGIVCIVMREEYLWTVEAYRDKLEPRMQQLVQGGQWELVSRERVEKYSFNNHGIIFTFKKLV